MKISSQILKTVIDIPENIIELTNKHIIEVDNYYKLVDTTPLVVGHVLECEKHENSDHLHVTKVDVKDSVLQIVCGAPNVAKGQHVIVAKVGSVLPGDFKIKNAKIRGVESFGMICSLSELGINEKYLSEDEKLGIYVFDHEVEVGSNAIKALNLDGFTVELGLTPNRSDLLSVLGYAKDLSAVTGIPLKQLEYKVTESKDNNPFEVNIKTPKGYLYMTRYFTNVEIKTSPWWLKSALIESGITPINNVVDITNYCLMLFGQPLHAFDANKINGNTIYVDETNGQEVVALDSLKYKLEKGDITINDINGPIAIAGVMGLENTMIDNDTNTVLLEAAIFDSNSIKDTSARLNLKSDSSLRFEKKIDYNNTLTALEYASYLLETLAGAKTHLGISKQENYTFKQKELNVSVDNINNKLGIKLSQDQIINYLERLEFNVLADGNILKLVVPSNRFDVEIEADVVEEVGRLYGLDDIANKKLLHNSKGGLTKTQKKLRTLRHLVSSMGFNETINYSLISEELLSLFKVSNNEIKLLKPLSMDRTVLRQDLASSLLSTAIYNNKRQNESLSLFEIGKVFNQEEEQMLGLLMSNSYITNRLEKTNIESSFFVLKGIVSNIAQSLNLEFEYRAYERESFHPYKFAKIYHNDNEIGYIGQLHPSLTNKHDLEDTFVSQLSLDYLLNLETTFTYEPVSKYPTITRDLSLVVLDDISSFEIIKLIKQTLKSVLVDVYVFDEYKGSNIEEGYKSIALRMLLNDRSKTLETKDIDNYIYRVIKRLVFELKADIRSE